MKGDTTPLADSHADLIFYSDFIYLNGMIYAYKKNDIFYGIEEISSRLNPSVDDLSFWKETTLRNRSVFSAIQQPRPFYTAEQDCLWLPYQEDWEVFYTLFSPINVNNTTENIISSYCVENGINNELNATIIKRWQNALGDYPIQWNELNTIVDDEAILPMLWAEPTWNVNMINLKLLNALVFYPWNGSGFKSPIRIYDRIVQLRMKGEVYPDDLRKIFADENDPNINNHFLSCFGTKSSFWKITINSDRLSSETILYRIPDYIPEEKSKYQVVKQIWRKEST